jgi:hypothetical protein
MILQNVNENSEFIRWSDLLYIVLCFHTKPNCRARVLKRKRKVQLLKKLTERRVMNAIEEISRVLYSENTLFLFIRKYCVVKG